ncbi:unnamed protein product, partial [Protopolystoma xenopodis]
MHSYSTRTIEHNHLRHGILLWRCPLHDGRKLSKDSTESQGGALRNYLRKSTITAPRFIPQIMMDTDNTIDPLDKNNDIDNLIIAAAAASGDSTIEIEEAVKHLLETEPEKNFPIETYSKKQGSELAYREMLSALSFKGPEDHPERINLL